MQHSQGSLTLPDAAIGTAFISYCESGQLSVYGQTIKVAISIYRPRLEILHTLRTTEYLDPQSKAEQLLAAQNEMLSRELDVVHIMQGWVDRNSSFLSEYAVETENIQV